MALAAVTSAAFNIGILLADEAKYLWGVKDEFKRCQMELSWMQCFLSLKDADVRQDEDRRIKMWVADIRELAYDAEDVVEIFALKIKSKRKGELWNDVKRSVCILKELWLRHKTRSKIEKILARVDDVTRRLQTYGIKELTDVHRSSASNVRRQLRQSYSYIDEDSIVGLTKEIEEVVTLVTKDCQCRVVSICGMGGLGKTTLAKKVFQHKVVREVFVHFAWVYVSQQFQRRKIWEQVLSNFNKMNDELRKKDDDDVAKELSNFLKNNNCLVILDDMWSTQDWSLLSPAFPTKESQSKFLLTSRNEEVAKAANDGRSCCRYELKVLNERDSWELFRKIAFQNISRDSSDYGRLEVLGKEMVKRCAGLPLAITVLGGILTKYSSQEWQKVSEHVDSYLKRDKEQQIEDVLALSYEELPFYLRPCFLYLSHFPEDYEISVDILIQLWIAEGFVSSELDEEETVENVAESYLVELVERFMVQVGNRDATLNIETCRMHDMMRELCLSKAKQENFLHIMDHFSYNKLSSHRIRRIVANGCPAVGIKGWKTVRSILFFDYVLEEDDGAESCIPFTVRRVLKLEGSWEYIFNNLKLIKVLCFVEGNRPALFKLPSDIGNLIGLRFLSFRGLTSDHDFELPSSLGNLTCLQTLDLRVFGGVYVPNVLWRLEQLKHLYLPLTFKQPWYKKNHKLVLHTLTKLQTLVNFCTEVCCLAHVSHLISLRKLEIVDVFISGDSPLIIKSKHIRSLSISFGYYDIDPKDVALFLSNCPNLCILNLERGNIHKLPEYRHFSSNIAEINLFYNQLKEDPMPTLEKLPNLRILNIRRDAFKGKKMVCSAHGFPKLHSLTLDALRYLKEWKVDEGAIPALRYLSISSCFLNKLPDRLRFIATLQELKIGYMPKSFEDKVKEEFKHVPSLTFHNTI